MSNKSNKKLPEEFQPLFWDANFEKIDLIEKKLFIIGRILEKGDVKSVKWVFGNYSKDDIKDAVLRYPNFTSGTYNFWNYYFNI